MCLSIPSKVIEIDDNNYATVETLGVKRQVTLDLIAEPVSVGDYVLIHVGFAMEKIDTKIALESLELYRQIAQDMASGGIDECEGDMGLACFSKSKASKSEGNA